MEQKLVRGNEIKLNFFKCKESETEIKHLNLVTQIENDAIRNSIQFFMYVCVYIYLYNIYMSNK